MTSRNALTRAPAIPVNYRTCSSSKDSVNPPVSLDAGAGLRTLRLLLNRLGGFRSQCVPRSPPERYPPRAIPSPTSRSHAPRPHRRTALSRRRCCQSASTPAIQQTYIPTIRLTYAECRRVTDGARTRDLRSHNPMLCLLSYGHQARRRFYQRKGAWQSGVSLPSRGTRSSCRRACPRRLCGRVWRDLGS